MSWKRRLRARPPEQVNGVVLGRSEVVLSSDAFQDVSESMRSSVSRSVFWVAIQKWGSQLSTLIVFALLARLLQPAEIGLAALAAVFVNLFQILADQGLTTALIQKKSVSQADTNTSFWIVALSACGLMGFVFVLAPFASLAFDQPQLAGVLCAMAPVIPLTALVGVPQALMERDLQFKPLTQRTLLGSAVGGAAGVAFAFSGAGVWSIVAQALVNSVIGLIFIWRATTWRPQFSMRRQSLQVLRTTGLSVLWIRLVALTNAQGDKLVIGVFLGPQALGYYYVGSRIVSILIDIQTSVIEAVSLTTLSRLQDDQRRLRSAFYTLTGVSAATAIGIFAIAAVTAPVVIPMLFGPHWQPAVLIMQILCVMGCLNSVIVFDRNALIAVGAAKSALKITVVQAVVGLVAVLAVVHVSAVAVALAVTVRQYAVWPLRLRLIRRAFGIRIDTYLRQWAGPMLSGLAVVAVSVGVAWLWQPAGGLLSRIAYVVVQVTGGLLVYVSTAKFTSPMAFSELSETVRKALTQSPVVSRLTGRIRTARLVDGDV